MKKFLLPFIAITIWANGANVKLSDGLNNLLLEEMNHIKEGMQDIFYYSISGDYENIAKIATKIQNSFVIKNKITKEQVKELKAKMPKEFFKIDKKFHSLAGELANLAEFEESEKINKTYGELMNLCVKCHSKFATDMFPKLKN